MGRPPCCDKKGMKKGPWTPEEDIILVSYIQEHGPGNWTAVPTNAGLMRSSKSCRLRWTNYLRPGIKRGNFTDQEEKLILHLQALLGNRWAAIASYLPERTDNDIKNYWNTRLMKKLRNKALSKQPNSRGQWERRLQTDIHKAKQALREALSLDNSSEDCHSEFMIKTTNVCNTYMSTENISRLLQGWMGSTPNPRGNRANSESTQHSATTTASTDSASIESFFGLDSSTQEVLESKPSCEGQVPLSMIETWLLDDDDVDVGQEDLIDMPLCYPLD